MATIRILTTAGCAHNTRVDSNRTKDIVRAAKQYLPTVSRAKCQFVTEAFTGDSLTRYRLYDNAGVCLGLAVYRDPKGY